MNSINDLQLELDLLLEEIEDINAEIYQEKKALEKVEAEYQTAIKDQEDDDKFKLTFFN